MTPAIDLAVARHTVHTVHSYRHDPGTASYGDEAAASLQIDPNRVFKTLVVEDNRGQLLVAVIPVSCKLNLKALARAAGAKKVEMADQQKVQRVTGYLIGGVSPLGQKKSLPTVVDHSVFGFETVYVSAGRRGLEIELSPHDLLALTDGSYDDLSVR